MLIIPFSIVIGTAHSSGFVSATQERLATAAVSATSPSDNSESFLGIRVDIETLPPVTLPYSLVYDMTAPQLR
jgi:hypothetical protein